MPATNRQQKLRLAGIQAALVSAVFLGLAPVFGRQAILAGFPPLAVVTLRTSFAALLVFLALVTFKRGLLFIYPAGLLGCILAGSINGIGSILYYSALGRIEAGLGQLVYSLYPLFVALWLWLDKQPASRLTFARLSLSLPALVLLTQSSTDSIDWTGVLLMLGGSALYALHLPVNQRVLFDMPAPTVTLYTLLAMSATVSIGYFVLGAPQLPAASELSGPAWQAVAGLTLVTFLSRLTLFMGVKHLGGLQTALLGLSELMVALLASHLILGERLSLSQWLGAVILGICVGLVAFERLTPPKPPSANGWLRWISATPTLPDIHRD